MFADLTFIENTELYLTIRRGYVKLDKLHGTMIDLGAYEAGSAVGRISHELIDLLEDLNQAVKVVPLVPGLAEHTAAAQEKIIEASR